MRLVLIAATSLDGFIARHDQPGTDFCSDADRAFLKQILPTFDSMILGRRTYDTLRDQLQASTSTRYLRKIITRNPDTHAADTQPDRIEFTNAAPAEIIAELQTRGRENCALLGGGEVYTAFLETDLVDELWLTLEPQLFGTGTPLATRPLDKHFQLTATQNLSPNTLLLKYKR